jgi:hypothetical protein
MSEPDFAYRVTAVPQDGGPAADEVTIVSAGEPLVFSIPLRPKRFENSCRVYWGSHGCDLERGHPGGRKAHDCGCCDCEHHPDKDSGCVGRYPFYGWRTRFYGEDVSAGERLRSCLAAVRRPRNWRLLDDLTRSLARRRAIPHGGPLPRRKRPS